ncbi:hypothetical protein G7Z17_g1511 [Cylindrodendrum hubeiense]|uniref:CBM-cenC domain-containing protein n=1 Tax=Cylindrodendrum hubeiense TaxID=595255 RepID=A0A9P5HPY1_9HYPO|nr:hypothetical protein G7Z17_g1511 [Cylindrodendrum hubeiense]
MRWISVCTIIGAALLPAVSARPLCHPDQTTTTLAATTEASSTISADSTSTTETSTATTEASSTVSIYTPTTPEITYTPTPTPVEPAPENLILNGDFEGDDLSVWSVRTVDIVDDAEKAHSPVHYARYFINNEKAVGGNQLNQTINGLDTTRLYRLTFSSAVFGSPDLGDETCALEALQEDLVIKSIPVDTSVVGQYTSYETDFTVDDEDIVFTLRLRCTSNSYITIDIAVDDIVINDIGLARI